MKIPPEYSRFVLPGLTLEQLRRLEQAIGFVLPQDHRDLLHCTDGFSVDGGLSIYGSDVICARNETWEVASYMPGFVAIGDSGGGDVFVIKLDDTESAVYAVGAGVMDEAFAQRVAPSIEAWLQDGLPVRPPH